MMVFRYVVRKLYREGNTGMFQKIIFIIFKNENYYANPVSPQTFANSKIH